MTQPTDPVCGMRIEEAEAAGQSVYEGQQYYFCSAVCKTSFDQDPEKFVKQTI